MTTDLRLLCLTFCAFSCGQSQQPWSRQNTDSDLTQAGALSTCEPQTSLSPISSGGIAGAVTQFNKQAVSGYTWASIQPARTFLVNGCSASLESLVTLLAEDERSATFADGTVYPSTVNVSPFFSAANSAAGPALQQAVDAFGGSTGQLWQYTDSVPCHNCSEFATRMVIWYPSTRRLVVLDGITGYDS